MSEEQTTGTLLRAIQPDQWTNIFAMLDIPRPSRVCSTCCMRLIGVANYKAA